MKTLPTAAALIFLFSLFDAPVRAQTGTPAQLQAQLSSDDPKARATALKQLGALGIAAKNEAAAVEECIKDPEWDVRVAAARALSQIVGPAQAVHTFDSIIRDATAKGRGAALVGLQTCGSLGLPALSWALKAGDDSILGDALVTASIVDVEGTLYGDVLPLLLNKSEAITYPVRKYLLATGIRKFFSENGRWPADFVEVESYIRKSNPLVTLAPLTTHGQIRFEPEPPDAIKVYSYAPQKDGTFKKSAYYVIQKPQKR